MIPRLRSAFMLVLILLAIRPSVAQRTIEITGDRLSGVVLPVLPLDGEISIRAMRAETWTVDDTKRLVLSDDVEINVAGHEFRADDAVIWLNRLPSAEGLINQVAIYFERLENPTRRAGIGVAGDRLLVTASARGEVTLDVALLEQTKPRRSPMIRRAEDRLALHLRRLLADGNRLATIPRVDRPDKPHQFYPEPGGAVEPRDYALPRTIELPEVDRRPPWLREPGSVVTFAAQQIDVEPGADENTITAVGSIVIEYFADPRGDELSQITLSAERAVIFTDPGTLEEMAAWELETDRIRGIYLEGDVTASANEGEYLIRAPRVYYDFRSGRAIMLDAVLRTYTRERKIPVYARAEEMRQIAENQWDAKQVRVSTSEFHVGHIALGANRMTVTRRPVEADPNDRETYFDARDISVRAGGTPVFVWPRFAGTIQDIPLKSVTVGSRDNDGISIETRWDLFSLFSDDRPENIDADLRIDGFTKRGAAVGIDADYDLADAIGALDLYGMYDDGVDRTSSGREVEQDGELRGVALWEHQADLFRHWSLQAQASYISDETFITARREDDFEERREYETSVYIKNQKDRAALTFLAKYELNDFISNSYLLASQQYQVDKLPELTFRQYGESIFGDAVTYSGESRLTRMRFVFDRSTPRELGVRGRAFGIDDDEQLSDALRAEGLESRFYMRADTRHEIAIPGQWGIFGVTPFFVARATAYDDDFDTFSSDSDTLRLFGAAGVRLNTHFQHIDNGVESRIFDLHRLRHIVEPSATLWYGYADVNQTDLPVYDYEVESIATGAAMRFGVRNVWQTQRGGPGRWRSVDVLTLDTDVVITSSDVDRESPSPQFFDYRPEYSLLGDHVRAAALWLLSDTFAVTGESTIDLDESAIARGSVGAELQHSPLLTTFVEFRYLDASDNELLDVGWRYRITPVYEIRLSPQWDFRADEFRSVRLGVTRSFPEFDLTVQVRHDEIRNDTSFGATIGLVEF